MSTFQDRVKGHLANYKNNTLNINENGIYRRNNRRYQHILPDLDKQMNILKTYKQEFYNSSYQKISYHPDFHHLNSSQAMCINFFYPLIKEKRLDLILGILGITGQINYDPERENILFEKKSDLDKYSQGNQTNFDFYIKLDSGTNIYFEIKYTENNFGKADLNGALKSKDPDKYAKKYKDLYKPLLANNPAINKDYKTEAEFYNNYQLLRNLLHINKDSYVIFIYPEENSGISKGVMLAKNNIIEKGWESHFIPITWEDIVAQLSCKLTGDLLTYYQIDFTDKYLKY